MKNIKTLKTTTYVTNTPEEILSMESRCAVPIVRRECTTQYDREGKQMTETYESFSEEGDCFDESLTYSYDEKGRLLSVDEEIYSHESYSYSEDSDGNTVVDVCMERADGMKATWRRIYSPDNLLLREEHEGEEGLVTMVYEYDSEGRVFSTVEETFEDRTTCEYAYDGEDVTVKKTVLDYIDESERVFIRRTIHDGDTVEEVETVDGREICRIITKRVQDGSGAWHPVDVRHMKDGECYLRYRYEYDGSDFDLLSMTKEGPTEGHKEETTYSRTYWED